MPGAAAGKAIDPDTIQRFKDRDLKKTWKKIKAKILKKVDTMVKEDRLEKKKAAALKSTFDRKLGPYIDRWQKQMAALSPKTKKTTLHSISAKIIEILKAYEYEIEHLVAGPVQMSLTGSLEQVRKELKRHEDWLRPLGFF